jgi:hypothetical protein
MGCIAKGFDWDMDGHLQLKGFFVLQTPVETDDLVSHISSGSNKTDDGGSHFEGN